MWKWHLKWILPLAVAVIGLAFVVVDAAIPIAAHRITMWAVTLVVGMAVLLNFTVRWVPIRRYRPRSVDDEIVEVVIRRKKPYTKEELEVRNAALATIDVTIGEQLVPKAHQKAAVEEADMAATVADLCVAMRDAIDAVNDASTQNATVLANMVQHLGQLFVEARQQPVAAAPRQVAPTKAPVTQSSPQANTCDYCHAPGSVLVSVHDVLLEPGGILQTMNVCKPGIGKTPRKCLEEVQRLTAATRTEEEEALATVS